MFLYRLNDDYDPACVPVFDDISFANAFDLSTIPLVSFEMVEYVVPSVCLKLIWEKYILSVLDLVTPPMFICPIAKVGISSKNKRNDFIKLFKLVPQ